MLVDATFKLSLPLDWTSSGTLTRRITTQTLLLASFLIRYVIDKLCVGIEKVINYSTLYK